MANIRQININYQIPESGVVELVIFDVLGKKVKTLVNRFQPAGEYNIIFKVKGLSNGIYFYKLTMGKFVQTRKMILMK